MKFHWSSKIVIAVVFFLVFGTFSTGFAENKKLLLQKKAIVQKTQPIPGKKIIARTLPDLSVTKITITPVNPVVTEKISVTAVVKNKGPATAPPSFFKIQIGGKVYPLIRVPGLTRNKTWQYKSEVNLKRTGRYRVTAVANPKNKLVESNYKNNTLIKNFRVKKIQGPKQPPSSPTPPNSPQPSFTAVTKLKPVTLAVQYSIEIVSPEVIHDNGIWSWKTRVKNNGTQPLPSNRLKLQAIQITGNGSEQPAGNPYLAYVKDLSPGSTSNWRGMGGWTKSADANKLRVEVMDVQTNIIVASKIIPFPSKFVFAGIKPLEVERAVQFSIGVNGLEVKKHSNPDYLHWGANFTNNGTNTPANYRLKARAIVILNNGSEQQMGQDRSLLGLYPGANVSSGEILGDRVPGTDRLRLEVWDTQTNFRIASQIINFPTDAELDVEPVRRFLQIKASEYLGNGQLRIEVKNTGNYNINPNELTVKAKYHIGGPQPLPECIPHQNNNVIPPGQTEVILISGRSNETGCTHFTSVDIFVYDSVKDKTYTDNISTPVVIGASIDEITLERSRLSYRMVNTAPFPIRVKVVLENIEIWDGPKPQSNNNSWWEDVVDVFDGADFDTSGLQPAQRKCTVKNIVLGSYSLQSGYNFMYAWPNETTFNNWLKAECPSVNFSSYSYLFKNLKIKLLTEVASVNHGNATGLGDHCNTAKLLDSKTISQGGTKDNPAFSW
jgi:CARDB protein